MIGKPLNGTKTHPLTKHSLGVLRDLASQRAQTYTINPGVIDRLMREGLAEIQHTYFGDMPGQRFLVITPAGRARLAQASETPKG